MEQEARVPRGSHLLVSKFRPSRNESLSVRCSSKIETIERIIGPDIFEWRQTSLAEWQPSLLSGWTAVRPSATTRRIVVTVDVWATRGSTFERYKRDAWNETSGSTILREKKTPRLRMALETRPNEKRKSSEFVNYKKWYIRRAISGLNCYNLLVNAKQNTRMFES